MAASDGKDFEQKISADPSGFLAGWQKAAAGAQSGADSIKGSVGKIGDVFSSLMKPLLAVSAALAGGKFFKECIDAANKLTGETMSLSKSLGITGTEASTLRTALEDIGSDSETYIGAFQKFAKQLKNNEDGLRAMGLQTRDANGNLRDSNTLFNEAIRTVGDYKPGLDQTTAAMTLFGKSVNEVMALQKLNTKVLDDAKKKNEELGLTITKEGVEASKKYKLAMNDVGDVFLAIKNVIGQAVMPIFTELANWFSEIGPATVLVFKGAVGGLAAAFHSLVLGIKIVFNALAALVDPLVTFGVALSKLISGDITGATNDMMALPSKWGSAWRTAFANIQADSVATQAKLMNLFLPGTEVGAPKGGTKRMGDFKATNGGQAEKSRMPEWEAQLAERKAALERQGLMEGQYRQMSRADEQRYWDDIKNMQGLSEAERLSVTKKSAEVELAGIKNTFEVKVATLQAEAAAFKNNTDERLRIERQIQAMYQAGTKEYEESAKRIVEIERQAAEQQRAIRETRAQAARDAELSTLALQQQVVQTAAQLGTISQSQALEAQQQFEIRRTEIARAALMERLRNAETLDRDRNLVEVAKINSELEALEQQHQLRLGQIRGAMVIENAKYQTDFFEGMRSNLQTTTNNILNGTQKLSTGFKSLFASMGQTLTQTVSKMAADWVIGQIKMRLASKETALAQLQSSAAAAAGAAYNAIVGIPYVGPFLAPVAAAVAYAGVLAFGSFASAEGGFDIPGGVNPIVQAHAREMVLPAKHADVIRSLADNGPAGAAAAAPLHWHGTPDDSVKARDLPKLLKRMGRDMVFVGR